MWASLSGPPAHALYLIPLFHLIQSFFSSALPSDVKDTLANISTFVQTKVNFLSTKLSKAKVIMEKIKELESQTLSPKDIEAMKVQSEQKIEEAIALHSEINKLKKDTSFLANDEIERLSALIATSKTSLYLEKE